MSSTTSLVSVTDFATFYPFLHLVFLITEQRLQFKALDLQGSLYQALFLILMYLQAIFPKFCVS